MLVKLDDERCMPKRAHPTDAGADLISIREYHLAPGEQKLFDTGVAVQIPPGMVGLIFNRSSQAKTGVQIPNSVGVIDADYRGNLMVMLRNTGTAYYTIKAFDTRIAQLVVVPIWLPTFTEYPGSDEDWVNTKRGTGGFGSTGV
jgi:dUTP pyrophosphatase